MIIIGKKFVIDDRPVIEYMEGNFDYVGRILSPKLIESFKQNKNTVLSYEIYKKFGEKKVIAELEDLLGYSVYLTIKEHPESKKECWEVVNPTVVVNRNPHYWYERLDDGSYVFYDYDEELLKLEYSKIPTSITLENGEKITGTERCAKYLFKKDLKDDFPVKAKRW